VLYLNQTNINDQGLAKLAKLGSLKELRLDRTLVTDAGMKEVPRFANLGKIVLKNDAITDRGLDALSKAPKLISIDLDNTDITDSGLRNLEKDCRFSWFGVGACRQVSPAAIRHFLKSVPKCAIGDWRDYTQDKKSRFYLKAK
jgi:hypothetical protein